MTRACKLALTKSQYTSTTSLVKKKKEKKSNSAALFRLSTEPVSSNHQVLKVVLLQAHPWESAKGEDPTLSTLQRTDPQLAPIVEYLEKGELPVDDERACELAVTKLQYTIVDRVLYRVDSIKTLRVIPRSGGC